MPLNSFPPVLTLAMDLNFPTGPPAEWLPNWKSQLLTIGSFLSTSTFPLLFTPDFLYILQYCSTQLFETPFIYFCHVIHRFQGLCSTWKVVNPTLVKKFMERRKTAYIFSFNVFIARLLIGGLEEKGTSCELMGDVSYFRRENSDFSPRTSPP